MAAENTDDVPHTPARDEARLEKAASEAQQPVEPDSDDDNDDDDDVDEEPKLKYSRLTRDLGPVYRNGDATATFVVAGDKMVRS
jgi:hypothetical protein